MIEFNKGGFVSEIRTAPQRKTTQRVNKNATKFYNWFKKIGGNLSFFDACELLKKFEQEEAQRSFKTKPDHVKKELNHKFTFNL